MVSPSQVHGGGYNPGSARGRVPRTSNHPPVTTNEISTTSVPIIMSIQKASTSAAIPAEHLAPANIAERRQRLDDLDCELTDVVRVTGTALTHVSAP